MSYFNHIQTIYDNIAKGEAMDAFEKYYHDEVVMVLEDGTPVKGKDANRDREKEFFSSVEDFHGIEVHGIMSNEEEGKTSVESTMDLTFKGGDRVKMSQVAVQDWDGEHIVRERFYATQD